MGYLLLVIFFVSVWYLPVNDRGSWECVGPMGAEGEAGQPLDMWGLCAGE
jgi:hypothetical protein